MARCHGHTAGFELPAIFHCSYKSALSHHLTLVAVYDTALFLFLFLFFKYIKHRSDPSSKLQPPLPRADKRLLRVRGRILSVYADMPTMNIQISFKFHAASKVLQNYNNFGLKDTCKPGV